MLLIIVAPFQGLSFFVFVPGAMPRAIDITPFQGRCYVVSRAEGRFPMSKLSKIQIAKRARLPEHNVLFIQI